jgi:hypothetical protein
MTLGGFQIRVFYCSTWAFTLVVTFWTRIFRRKEQGVPKKRRIEERLDEAKEKLERLRDEQRLQALQKRMKARQNRIGRGK